MSVPTGATAASGEPDADVAGAEPDADVAGAEPEGAAASGEPDGAPAGARRRKSRTVLWASIGAAVVLAALFAVIVSAQPATEVQAKSPLLGQRAPSISGAGLAGGHYSLSEFRSKWVLVNFMATWCNPCRQEMPQLLTFAKQHENSAVVLTVPYDPTNVAQLKKYLTEKGASWPAVNDPEAPVAYGVQGLPSSFLVAPGGTVIAYIPGEINAKQLSSYIRRAATTGIAA